MANIVRTVMALCVMALFIGSASAVANIVVDDCYGNATVPINVNVADNVGSVDVTLEYDPAVAKLVRVDDGDMDATVVNTERSNEGIIRIGAYQTNSEGIYGEFVIASVYLEPSCDEIASCPLDISVTTFKDATPAGNSMAYSITDGVYRTNLDNVPGFLGAFAIALVFVVALFRRREHK